MPIALEGLSTKKPIQTVIDSENFYIYQAAADKFGNIDVSLANEQLGTDGSSLPEGQSKIVVESIPSPLGLIAFWTEVYTLKAAV